MDAVTVFFAEIAFCVAVSTLILARLQRLLRRIGNEVCEQGGGSTEFWVAYTQLMMVIAPLLLVALFTHAGQTLTTVQQLKGSLAVVLSGQVLGLVLVGRAVWKSIVRPAPQAPAPREPIPMGAPLAKAA
jgi:isoprenylcysteine carboxyl methyltransferase (ICMT) family protein YpbQ